MENSNRKTKHLQDVKDALDFGKELQSLLSKYNFQIINTTDIRHLKENPIVEIGIRRTDKHSIFEMPLRTIFKEINYIEKTGRITAQLLNKNNNGITDRTENKHQRKA